MDIQTTSTPYQKSHPAANSTSSSFASVAASATPPSGAGVIDIGPAVGPNGVMLQPFGAGADNDTFDMRVFGWREVVGVDGIITWWPVLLGGFSCTLCAVVGLTNGTMNATQRAVDTITLKSNEGTANVSNEIVSPVQDIPAHIILDVKGCEKIEIRFDMTGATSANCLVAKL